MNPPPLETIYVITSVVVPLILLTALPPCFEKLTKHPFRSRALLVMATALFFISWYLPSPLIEGRYTAFTTHLVGGGMFTGLLWIIIRSEFNLKIRPLIELIALYFLVSGLGVANELFELALSQVHLTRLSGADTWWDLLANTAGAVAAYISFFGIKIISKRRA